MSNKTFKYNSRRVEDRQIDELIGLVSGLLADGKLDVAEVNFLKQWLIRNRTLNDNQIFNNLTTKINDYLLDGIFDEDESKDFFETLRKFSLLDIEEGELQKSALSYLDFPEPEIEFENRIFCFTGTFVFGTRNQCEQMTVKCGGLIGTLNKDTDYLVVGTYATEDWKHSNFGRKIEKAQTMQLKKLKIKIVSEENWSRVSI